MDPIKIVFASDKGYVPHLATAIVSLIKNNKDLKFEISVINSDIRQSDWERINSLGKSGDHIFINLKIAGELFNGLVLSDHFTKAIYYRLLIPELIRSDRVLYLDSDIVINGQIEELYKTDLDEVYLAAVEEPNFIRHEELGMTPGSKYFNSGVLLMNLGMWRRDSIRDRVIEFIRNKPGVIKFPDQCGMNAVINGRWKSVHLKYNLQSAIYDFDEDYLKNIYGLKELREAKTRPVIIHFTGSTKPWHDDYNLNLQPLYWYYRKFTPYRNKLSRWKYMNKWYIIKPIKKIIPDFIKAIIKSL
jgi:lipopolysaccharide biosynthesis glycosyltransferase